MSKPAPPPSNSSGTTNSELSFFKRASLTRHPVAQQLFQIMEKKQTNLSAAIDVTKQADLLRLADELGPELCMVKTHVDILDDFTPDFGSKLRALAEKHNFLIFEDRKFADIGQVVSLQASRGIYRIADWAHIINAHIVPGPGIIAGLRQANKNLALLLLAEMSAEGMMAKGAYTKRAVELGEQNLDFVIGFISLRRLSDQPGMIHCTPGVQLKPGKDSLGQRYRTVKEIVEKKKSDLVIVGRDIVNAPHPRKQAALYREAAWKAYQARL